MNDAIAHSGNRSPRNVRFCLFKFTTDVLDRLADHADGIENRTNNRWSATKSFEVHPSGIGPNIGNRVEDILNPLVVAAGHQKTGIRSRSKETRTCGRKLSASPRSTDRPSASSSNRRVSSRRINEKERPGSISMAMSTSLSERSSPRATDPKTARWQTPRSRSVASFSLIRVISSLSVCFIAEDRIFLSTEGYGSLRHDTSPVGVPHSHSIVPGGLLVTSQVTRLMPLISLMTGKRYPGYRRILKIYAISDANKRHQRTRSHTQNHTQRPCTARNRHRSAPFQRLDFQRPGA